MISPSNDCVVGRINPLLLQTLYRHFRDDEVHLGSAFFTISSAKINSLAAVRLKSALSLGIFIILARCVSRSNMLSHFKIFVVLAFSCCNGSQLKY